MGEFDHLNTYTLAYLQMGPQLQHKITVTGPLHDRVLEFRSLRQPGHPREFREYEETGEKLTLPLSEVNQVVEALHNAEWCAREDIRTVEGGANA